MCVAVQLIKGVTQAWPDWFGPDSPMAVKSMSLQRKFSEQLLNYLSELAAEMGLPARQTFSR